MPRKHKKTGGAPRRIQYQDVDWSLSDAENGRKLGCSREYIRQLRKRLRRRRSPCAK